MCLMEAPGDWLEEKRRGDKFAAGQSTSPAALQRTLGYTEPWFTSRFINERHKASRYQLILNIS